MTSETETEGASTTLTGADLKRTVFAGAYGNVIEYYDFACYGFMAPILAQLFFPSDDGLSSLLATFGAFAAGYMARPLGAIFFGHLGDRYGRKIVLITSVAMMGTATVAIGVLPTHEQWGATAGVLLVALRVFQGFSVGGEYTGSLVFVAEHSPPDRRAFFCSWIMCGSNIGFLVGSAVATILANVVSDDQLKDWGWRIPFLLSAVIAAAGFILRLGVEEPPTPEEEPELEHSPVIHAVRDHWRELLQVMGLTLAVNVGFYIIFVYAISYLTDIMHVSVARAMDINTLCLFVLALLPLATAFLSDRIGRKPLILGGTLAMFVFAWPLFDLMHSTAFLPILVAQLGFATIFCFIYGANPASQVEIVPHHVRVSVLCLGFNVCMMIFGGTAPLVAAYLVQRTGDDFAPAYYLMGLAVLSLIAALTIPETRGKRLHH